MHSKPVLGREEVARALGAAHEEAQRQGWAMSIAMVDDGGHLLALERLDGYAPIGAYIATERARSTALGRREAKHYKDMINDGCSAFLSVPLLQATLEGGVPILMGGQVVGAVGVSGVRAEEDAQVARIEAEGLRSDRWAPPIFGWSVRHRFAFRADWQAGRIYYRLPALNRGNPPEVNNEEITMHDVWIDL